MPESYFSTVPLYETYRGARLVPVALLRLQLPCFLAAVAELPAADATARTLAAEYPPGSEQVACPLANLQTLGVCKHVI